jgi:hypothetical protein
MAAWNVLWVEVDRWMRHAFQLGDEQAAGMLGGAVQQVLNGRQPSQTDGIGTLSAISGRDGQAGQGLVPLVMPLGTTPPLLLRWAGGELSIVQSGRLGKDDLAGAARTGPFTDGEQSCLLLSVSAPGAREVCASDLGTAVYRLLREPGLGELQTGKVQVRTGPLVRFDEECHVLWLHAQLRDPAALSPSEKADLVGEATEPNDRDSDADLSVAGFLLTGGSFETTFVPAGPGLLTVFFGRNGAGKSLALNTIDQALRDLRGAGAEQETDPVKPACTLLLQAPVQEEAPRLFAQVLAHLGWGPDSSLPPSVTSFCKNAIPDWDNTSARPADAHGLTVAQLGRHPLPQLRDTVTDAITASMLWCTSGRQLAEAITSSSVLAVSPDWRVGLAVIPGPRDRQLQEAAEQYLADARAPWTDPAVVADNLQQAILPWARQLAGELPAAPVVIATANLPHAGPWPGYIDPGPSWRQLGEELAGRVIHIVPRPVMFAPGRTTLQLGDLVAEQAVATLAERLLETSDRTVRDNRRHVFARFPGHADRFAALLQLEANRLLPRFVADTGTVSIRIADQGEWHERRAIATFTGGIGGEIGIDDLPSGLRTWVHGALSFATTRLTAAAWTGTHAELGWSFTWASGDSRAVYESPSTSMSPRKAISEANPASLEPVIPSVPKILYLLDEPEAHLHLTAQQDIVNAAFMLAEASCGVIAATHSLSFLDTRPASAQIVTLDATDHKIRSSSWTGLQDLAKHAEALGITPSSIAVACRGVLIVEGPHDREIIQRYGGVDLDKQRILVIPLHGVDYAKGIAELEFLHSFRIPLHIMFDHLSAQVVKGITRGQRPGRGATMEERLLWQLRDAFRQRQLHAHVLPFEYVDIVRAVPEKEIAWAIEQLGGRAPFAGWADLDAKSDRAWKERRRRFKDTFEDVTGVPVTKVINRLRDGNRRGQSEILHGLLSAMLEYKPDTKPRSGLS